MHWCKLWSVSILSENAVRIEKTREKLGSFYPNLSPVSRPTFEDFPGFKPFRIRGLVWSKFVVLTPKLRPNSRKPNPFSDHYVEAPPNSQIPC